MATYYVDDGGDNTTGASWATAYTSINALDTAVALASGDIVYFGHDSQCQAVNATNLTITGPASGLPVKFISATTGSNPPTYQQATANQIDTSEGNYYISFDGSFALYGMKIKSGGTGINNIFFNADTNEISYSENCIFVFAAGAGGMDFNAGGGTSLHINPTIDLTADGTTNRTGSVVRDYLAFGLEVSGLTFINAGYRTGTIFGQSIQGLRRVYSGCDFSGFNNATLCEFTDANFIGDLVLVDCKTAATWAVSSAGYSFANAQIKFVNCGSGDQPVALYAQNFSGALSSSSSIYRTGGGTAEGTAFALLVTTTATCSPETPFCTDWFYNTLSTTGSKTWKAYVVNDTADLNDNEAWLEIQYKATASSGQWTTVTDKPATITTAAAAQTDDTTSTWNGTGPSFTYMQELSVTATVNTTGQWRGRICFGKASVSAASNLYLDPDISVS